jgi:site-specific DNA-methyltransferase (adenine-specific)
MVAAIKWHRNSIGLEIDRDYCRLAARRLMHESTDLFSEAELQFLKLLDETETEPQICEDPSRYRVRRAPRRRAVSVDEAV